MFRRKVMWESMLSVILKIMQLSMPDWSPERIPTDPDEEESWDSDSQLPFDDDRLGDEDELN
jgi:hypothetical protein